MRTNFVSALLFVCLCLSLPAFKKAEWDFFQVQAKAGDTQRTILGRFYLTGYGCDADKFRVLNNLTPTSKLVVGRKYKLPVMIATYNGKSIRTSLGITDYAKAQRIQIYNERLTKNKVRLKSFKESKILWVPWHEWDGCKPDVIDTDQAPSATTESGSGAAKSLGKFPIFGSRYANIKRVSNRLKGKVFYVESGHGGPDPGATSKVNGRTLCEDEYAYDIALRVSRLIMENGGTAYVITRDINDGIRTGKFLTCDCDEQTYPAQKVPTNQKARLTQRSEIINKLYDSNKTKGVAQQRALVIHVDSRTKNERIDAFFYYNMADEKGKKLALGMQETLKKRYKRTYRGTVEARDLHMVRELKPQTVFVEVGNIQNPFDQQRLLLETNRQLLSQWLYEGLTK
jgi:N-acetylmuramoyl-L-alanine amidase